jgi:hypothetical protein
MNPFDFLPLLKTFSEKEYGAAEPQPNNAIADYADLVDPKTQTSSRKQGLAGRT